MTAKSIIVMILAGVACAITVLSAARVGPGAVPLLMMGALPIYIASLSFGTAVGVGASIIAIFAAGIAGSTQSAMVMGLAFTIPASIIGHQANLAQPIDDNNLEWYPLPRLFFNLCVLLSAGIIILGFVVNYDTALLTEQMNTAVNEVLSQNPQSSNMTNEEITNLSEGVIRIMPFVFSGIWLITHVASLYLASMVSRTSGLMPRPKDDIPASAGLLKSSIIILLISIVCASFLDGKIQLIASVISGVFIMGYALLGLANMHYKTRGNPSRMILILFAYGMIILLYVPIYLFAVTGIIRNINGSQQTPPSNDGT